MLIRCRRASILILSVTLLRSISHRNSITEAFDRPTIPSDHTRRAALERFSFLTLVNIGFVLSPTNPSCALEGDSSGHGNINGDGDLSLAQPMGPSGESRPSAPLEYLLPAARVGIYIYHLFSITEELTKLQQTSSSSSNGDSTTNINDIIAKLDSLLLSPPSFIKTSDPSVSRGDQYGKYSLPIVGEIGIAAQKQRERRDRSIDVGFAPQFFEVGELVGERRQWNQLQSAERKREGANEIRRALNIYTTNLNFSPNKYQWVGSTQEKSRRIRNDKLPTTTDVIRSDLDARDLYRNQVQTSLDDARAEFLYQQRESSEDIRKFDPTELLDILGQLQASVDKWFGFIPDKDVKLALEAVQREQM
jgi:hypothetical protein